MPKASSSRPPTPVTVTLNERDDKTEIVFVQAGFEDTASRHGDRDGWDEAFIAVPDELARLIDEAAST